MRNGRLLLVPVPLHDDPARGSWLSPADTARIAPLAHWFVETPRTARRWLGALGLDRPLAELDIRPIPAGGANDGDGGATAWLRPLFEGHDVGLMSDAGCPGVADPGALVVAAAQAAGLTVEPLAGPSSILQALMASGLQGQRFMFHGYLPVPSAERTAAIRDLYDRALRDDATQILIETPYRNAAMQEALLATLPPTALLTIATGIGHDDARIRTRRIAQWRQQPAPAGKVPTVYCLYPGNTDVPERMGGAGGRPAGGPAKRSGPASPAKPSGPSRRAVRRKARRP